MLPFQRDQSRERTKRRIDLIAVHECGLVNPLLFQEPAAGLNLVGEVADPSHECDCGGVRVVLGCRSMDVASHVPRVGGRECVEDGESVLHPAVEGSRPVF
jgi:hypothetical protein